METGQVSARNPDWSEYRADWEDMGSHTSMGTVDPTFASLPVQTFLALCSASSPLKPWAWSG